MFINYNGFFFRIKVFVMVGRAVKYFLFLFSSYWIVKLFIGINLYFSMSDKILIIRYRQEQPN